jgi:hypothetical protein
MDSAELDRIVEGWIAFYRGVDQGCGCDDSLFWATEDVMDIVSTNPQEALQLILAILNRVDSMCLIGILSAGPFEDLLKWHGDRVVAEVEEEAMRNPKFASLLGGIYTLALEDHIAERVMAIRDRSIRDGHR